MEFVLKIAQSIIKQIRIINVLIYVPILKVFTMAVIVSNALNNTKNSAITHAFLNVL